MNFIQQCVASSTAKRRLAAAEAPARDVETPARLEHDDGRSEAGRGAARARRRGRGGKQRALPDWTRRPAGAPLAGLWEFPGGKRHAGESAAQAAERETHEETGLVCCAVGVHDRVTKTYDYGTVEVTFVACQLVAMLKHRRAPFRWVPAAELARFEFPAANAALVQRLVTSGSSSSSA